MKYEFFCNSCYSKQEKEIRMSDYEEEKENQFCDNCGCKMERVIEWHGMAKGAGGGWCGKSTGNAI